MVTDKRAVWIDLTSYQIDEQGLAVSAPLNDFNCTILIKGQPNEIVKKYTDLLEDIKNAIIKATH